MIARQLNIHIDMNTLRHPFQSAYRHGHSTETALLRVKDYIAATLDDKGKVVPVMLDLSSAFDTINHDVLMNRLQHSVGITDAALSWLHSYITESYRRQRNISSLCHSNNNNNNCICKAPYIRKRFRSEAHKIRCNPHIF